MTHSHACSACWTQRLSEPASRASSRRAGRGVLAIDGKTLRRSFDRAASRSALHVVTAFACEARLVLGQVAVPAGGNEITAARTLLGLLGGRCSSRCMRTCRPEAWG